MKQYRYVVALFCVLLLGGVVFFWRGVELAPKERVERQFYADLEELTQTAELALAGQEVEAPSGWQDVSRFDDVVCFDYGGWGVGSSTRYWGVNYVADDRLVGFQGTSIEGAVPEGDGWLWEQVGGDNRCYVEQLTPCWYYFEARF